MTMCNDRSLEALLDADDGGCQHQDVAAHVESCERCQARLGQLAGDMADWREAQQWLSQDEALEGHDQSSEPSKSRSSFSSWTESMATQLLGPPSHPEMLGRIGRYDVERLVGAGGMGIVFRAFDTELNRPVAIKFLAPYLAGSGAARKRFAREARAAAAVVDEHVVAIHDVESDGESPFLVMQYVPGESLQSRLDRKGPLEVCEVLRIGMQTAVGLRAAHGQGLIHRDVKPSNILLEESVDRALLTDFGLARAGDDASLTHSGYHLGTPQYMSPEQARGEAVDQRSDQFSLGSVLYAMCTGRAPFRAETSYGVLRRITDEEPRPIRDINPEIPQWLCGIIAKLMAKRPDDRFDSAGEVAEMLEEGLAHVQQPANAPLRKDVVSGFSHKPRAGGRFRPTMFNGFLAAAFLGALIFAGFLIVLEFNKGTLTIESEVDIPIRIIQRGKVVAKLTVTKNGATIRIAAGEYIVEIGEKIDGITIENGTIFLRRRGRVVVRVVRQAPVQRTPGLEGTTKGAGVDGAGLGPDIQIIALPDALTARAAWQRARRDSTDETFVELGGNSKTEGFVKSPTERMKREAGKLAAGEISPIIVEKGAYVILRRKRSAGALTWKSATVLVRAKIRGEDRRNRGSNEQDDRDLQQTLWTRPGFIAARDGSVICAAMDLPNSAKFELSFRTTDGVDHPAAVVVHDAEAGLWVLRPKRKYAVPAVLVPASKPPRVGASVSLTTVSNSTTFRIIARKAIVTAAQRTVAGVKSGLLQLDVQRPLSAAPLDSPLDYLVYAHPVLDSNQRLVGVSKRIDGAAEGVLFAFPAGYLVSLLKTAKAQK